MKKTVVVRVEMRSKIDGKIHSTKMQIEHDLLTSKNHKSEDRDNWLLTDSELASRVAFKRDVNDVTAIKYHDILLNQVAELTQSITHSYNTVRKTKLREQSVKARCLSSNTTKLFYAGLIGFGNDVSNLTKEDFKDIDFDELDLAAKKTANKIAKSEGCKVVYLVRHDDESQYHYHFLMTAYDENNLEIIRTRFKGANGRVKMSGFQDIAGNEFQSLGFNRGAKKDERLQRYIESNNIFFEDFMNMSATEKAQIYLAANVKNKSVSQLHRDEKNLHKKLEQQNSELEEQIEHSDTLVNAKAKELAKLKKDHEELGEKISTLKEDLTQKENDNKFLTEKVTQFEVIYFKAVNGEYSKEDIDRFDAQLSTSDKFYSLHKSILQCAYTHIESTSQSQEALVSLNKQISDVTQKLSEREVFYSKATKTCQSIMNTFKRYEALFDDVVNDKKTLKDVSTLKEKLNKNSHFFEMEKSVLNCCYRFINNRKKQKNNDATLKRLEKKLEQFKAKAQSQTSVSDYIKPYLDNEINNEQFIFTLSAEELAAMNAAVLETERTKVYHQELAKNSLAQLKKTQEEIAQLRIENNKLKVFKTVAIKYLSSSENILANIEKMSSIEAKSNSEPIDELNYHEKLLIESIISRSRIISIDTNTISSEKQISFEMLDLSKWERMVHKDKQYVIYSSQSTKEVIVNYGQTDDQNVIKEAINQGLRQAKKMGINLKEINLALDDKVNPFNKNSDLADISSITTSEFEPT